MNVVGYLNIGSNLLWDKGVLGKTYNIKICDVELKMHFPQLSNEIDIDNYNKSLIAPKIINDLELREDYVDYGIVISSPKYDCHINYVVITGEISNYEKIKELFIEADNWVHSFINIIKLKQNIIVHESGIEYDSNLLELFIKEKNYASMSNVNMPTFTFYINEDTINNNCVKKTLEILNNNIIIPVEYEFLLKAIEYYEKKQYRNCVLECATASEIVVTNRIISNCEKNNIKGYMDTIKKYNGLESKYRILLFFNDKPQLDINKITTPRNKAIHNGKNITEDEARECLKITKKLIDTYIKFY